MGGKEGVPLPARRQEAHGEGALGGLQGQAGPQKGHHPHLPGLAEEAHAPGEGLPVGEGEMGVAQGRRPLQEPLRGGHPPAEVGLGGKQD